MTVKITQDLKNLNDQHVPVPKTRWYRHREDGDSLKVAFTLPAGMYPHLVFWDGDLVEEGDSYAYELSYANNIYTVTFDSAPTASFMAWCEVMI